MQTITIKLKHAHIIWNIMGTLSVVLFSTIGRKLVHSLMIVVRDLKKLMNTIPK